MGEDRERRLATILVADIVGYLRLMDADEEGTYTALHLARTEVINPELEKHRGHILKHMGDGFLAEFPTVMSAVQFALAMQERMRAQIEGVPEDKQIKYRIGINLGDIMVDDDGDIFGDGVNIAAWLECRGLPGGICISSSVYELVHKKLDVGFYDLGDKNIENISAPVHVYEIQQEGEARAPKERAVKPTAKLKPPGLIVGGVLAAVAIIGVIIWQMNPSEPIEPSGTAILAKSIAVLPFVNMSSDPEQEYFSDGISAEILNVLAAVDGLQVTSRSSSFSFKGQNLDVQTMAARLGVQHVLEGSVRRDGDRVRITAQLVAVDQDVYLWSETYDRELSSIFAIQDEIAGAIVDSLRVELGLGAVAAERRVTTNPDAYEAFLRGNHLIAQRTKLTLEAALGEYQRALAFDETFGRAYAQLGMTQLLLRRTQYGDFTLTEAVRIARPYITRALELDPDAAEVQAAAGYEAWIAGRYQEASQHFDRALEANPSYATIFNWRYRMFIQDMDRPAEGFAALTVARRLDPLSLPTLNNYVIELTRRGRIAEAVAELEKLKPLGEQYYNRTLALFEFWQGNLAAAALANMNVVLIDPDDIRRRQFATRAIADIGLESVAAALARRPDAIRQAGLGRLDVAVEIARAGMTEDPLSTSSSRNLAIVLAAAGQIDEARPILEALWQEAGGKTTSVVGAFAMDAAPLVHLLGLAGETAKVEEVSTTQERRTATLRAAGLTDFVTDFDEGMMAIYRGDIARGVALVRRAVEKGYIVPPNWAFYDQLYAQPGYAVIAEIQAAHQARERQILLSALCAADSPYAPILTLPEALCFVADGNQ